MKSYKVIYRSRYHPFEGNCMKTVRAASKAEIRQNWHDIICTDEYRIVRIEPITLPHNKQKD